ncbi:MAG: putative metal-binding motif-containing protein [Dokdonella sp.]|uniref:putative metal-binding motif-containing protein n=1 Tax=Dokdonella sp. TaxID=2291710 RepID=UPI0032642392
MRRLISIAVMLVLSTSSSASTAPPLTLRTMTQQPADLKHSVIGPDGSVGHPGGDCNDTDSNIHPGQADIVGNGIDDNCNGLADEAANGDPSTDGSDADGDGNTIAAGDCNDLVASVHAGALEIIGDLIDNNCNGLADEDENGNPSNDTVDHDGDGVAMAPDRIFLDGFEG